MGNTCVTDLTLKRENTEEYGLEQKVRSKTITCSKMSTAEEPESSEKSIKYFDFGKPCVKCRSDKLKKNLTADIRCNKCFRITYIYKQCSEDDDCNLLNDIMDKRTSEVIKALWKKILGKRQSEEFVQIQSYTLERIHEAEVETTITLSKWLKDTDLKRSATESIRNNSIELNIKGVDTKNNIKVDDRQRVYVRLEDMLKMKRVGLYEKGGTGIELKLLNSFKETLEAIPINVTVDKDVLGYLESCEDYLIVICLHQSRMIKDVRYTLENIPENYFRRLILVLVHYKKNDTDCHAAELQESYSTLKMIDYFQHPEKENLKEVINQIKAIIFG